MTHRFGAFEFDGAGAAAVERRPSGIPTAKIALARENGKVTQLTIADPNLMVTARRV